MTSDEALIEKMAEAINEARLHQLATSTELARAALSVVRENDKMVQAGSTGAVRSTDLSGIDLQPGDSVVCLVSDGDLLVAGNHYTVSMLPKAHYVALTAFPGVFFQAGRFEYAHTNVLTLPREGAAQAEPAVAIVDVGQEFFSIVDCESFTSRTLIALHHRPLVNQIFLPLSSPDSTFPAD